MASGPKPGPAPLYASDTQKSGHGPPPPGPPASGLGGAGKKRTTHACDRCRLMRTKCSGGLRCSRCVKDDAMCVYGDHKRERNKKDFADSVSRVKELEGENRVLVSALRQATMAPDFRHADNEDIVNLLSKYQDDSAIDSPETSQSRSRSFKSPTTKMESRTEDWGESKVASNVGSPGSQGELRKIVVMDQGKGAAGFVGKMSEMSWMQRCREHMINQSLATAMELDSPQIGTHTVAAVDLTYFVDDQDLLAIDEDHIDALQLPSSEVMLITTQAYFHATEGAFHFLLQDEFLQSLYNLRRDGRIPSGHQRRWLALANLVWAVGTKWLQLARLERSQVPEQHLIYYARARALGMDHRISFDHPDVDVVMAMGVLTFYLLINGSISRAWNAIGNAVRHAMTLGMHLRVSDPSITYHEQMRRARAWFSLYKLQILIAEITGRPQFIRSAHVTIALETLERYEGGSTPQPSGTLVSDLTRQAREVWLSYLSMATGAVDDIVEGKTVLKDNLIPGSDSIPDVFVYHIRLCQLSEEIADQLYTGRHEIPWVDTQARIKELQRGLDAWTFTLPEGLRVDRSKPLNQNHRVNIHLAMYAYSVTMILHRPCLCEIVIDNESERSKQFNWESAKTCVRSAMSMLELMPDDLMTDGFYQLMPWWTLLHYLCQASAVLLLELCLACQHFQGETAQITAALMKATSYIASLTPDSISAYKAWRIFDDLLQRVSLRFDDASFPYVPQRVSTPNRWSAREESALLAALE